MDFTPTARRRLRTRQRSWAHDLGARVAAAGVSANAISLMSVAASALAAGAFVASTLVSPLQQAVLLVAAAGFIQLRLLANMLDGLVAVESGKHTATGDLFNEIPDRIDDLLILTAAGAATGSVWGLTLGGACAVLALFTAYVRVLAGSLGLRQRFLGPMAKQHRMALLTAVTLFAAAACTSSGFATPAIAAGLVVIAAGSVVTIVRRVAAAAAELQTQ